MKDLVAGSGGMAAVGMSPEAAKKYKREELTVACENSPQSITLSGDAQVLAEVIEQIQAEKPDTFCRRLDVAVAYHSGKFITFDWRDISNDFIESMQQPGAIYERHIQSITPHSSIMTPFYSTVTGKQISNSSALDAAYWRSNLQSPVLFNDALQNMIRDSVKPNIFVEIGPHSALSSPIRQILRLRDPGQTSQYIPTLIRNQPQQDCMLMTAGRLYSSGVPVELSVVNGKTGNVLTDLPSYPWVHEKEFWNETRLFQQWRGRQHPCHELLGSRCLESSEIEPSWRRILQVDHVPWLLDHALNQDVIFPCAGYIAMAGEAIRQLTGSEKYTIRNLIMHTPLVLREQDAVEVLTNLRPLRLTDTTDSTWFEITIMAYQTGSWKRHCVGQVRAGSGGNKLTRDSEIYPRPLSSKAWYGVFKKFRWGYGPEFQRLENISANPSACQAVASAQPHSTKSDSSTSDRYALHPTIIDQSLQLLCIASIHGIPRKMKTMNVPAAIESIDICPGKGPMTLYASCDTSSKSLTGSSNKVADGHVILLMKNATLMALEERLTASEDPSMIARLVWKPHVDLNPYFDQSSSHVSGQNSTDLLENLTHSLTVDTARKVQKLLPASPHLKAYQSWITSQAKTPRKNSNTCCKGSLCREDHLGELIKKLELEMPELSSLFHTARKILELSDDLMQGQISPQEIANEEDSLRMLNEFAFASVSRGDFFDSLGHSNPSIRVLAIGIGDGFALSQALQNLTSESGVPMYEKIIVVDASADRISREKEKTRSIESVEYVSLDIHKDIIEQGLDAEGYDLIIANNTFDAARQASSVFKDINGLLAQGGRILYQESLRTIPLVNYLMGIFTNWWEQQIQGQEWQKILQEPDVTKEFEVVSSSSHYPIKTTILSRSSAVSLHRGDIILLCLSKVTDWGRAVESHLVDAGYNATWKALGESLPRGGDVISFIDLERPFFDNMSQDSFAQLQLLTTQLMSCRTLWITGSSQISCCDPRFGLVLGLSRTIRHEITANFFTLEIDDFNSDGVASVGRVLRHIQHGHDYSSLDPDREFAVHKGVIHVSRVHWTPIEKALEALSLSENYGRALDIETYGLLGSLAWCEQGPKALNDDEVEIDMKYCSLNFRVSVMYRY
jgi:hypothetical protein